MEKEAQLKRRIDPLCSVSSLALMVVLGPTGGIGKTKGSKLIASYLEAADLRVRSIRVETGVRANEFGPRDIVIDLDNAAEAALGLGGEATIFEPAWSVFEDAMAGKCAAVVDGGANAHPAILGMAGLTGLSAQIAAAGRQSAVFVVTTPDPETARQALTLVQDARERMPESHVVLVVNYRTPTERPGLDTPQAQAFRAALRPHIGIPMLVLPFARGHALTALTRDHRSFLSVMRAGEADLLKLTGGGKVATATARTFFAAWWRDAVQQLEQMFPV